MIDAHRRTEAARRPNRCPCCRAKAVNVPTAKTGLPSLPKSDCDEGKIGAHPLDDANGSDAPTPRTHGVRRRCAQRKKSCAAHTLGRRQLMPRSFAFAGSQPRWGRLCPARFNPCTDAAFHPRNRFDSPFRGSQAILPLPISCAISIPIHGCKYCDKCHNLKDCYLIVTTFGLLRCLWPTTSSRNVAASLPRSWLPSRPARSLIKVFSRAHCRPRSLSNQEASQLECKTMPLGRLGQSHGFSRPGVPQ